MSAIYDKQVKERIEDYDDSLKKYPISPQRRKVKVQQLRRFLQGLSNNPKSRPLCNSIKLGQRFDSKGNPLFPNLRQDNYDDESGTQWRMSFFQVSANKVKIYRLYFGTEIDEAKEKLKSNVIYLTESKLKTMIEECMIEIIEELRR